MKIALILILGLNLSLSFAQSESTGKERTRVGKFLENIFGKKSDRKKEKPQSQKVIQDVTPKPEIKKETLADKSMPGTYLKRDKPVVRAALVYHGEYSQLEDLDRIEALITERFYQATNRLLSLEIVFKRVLPFKHNIKDYPEYTQPHVTDMERLQRLWYYDNVNMKVITEIYQEVKPELADIDVLLAITGAQYDGLAFASGRLAVTENPREIAWGLQGGGRVEEQSDEKIVDELIHELGHTLFLDHASGQCFKPGMTYKEQMDCCALSENADDVMSYCRDRAGVNETFYNKFQECNLRTIKNKIIPAMLSGGQWNIKDREKCL